MIRIAITPEVETDSESRVITRLLDTDGFDIVHLRHPGASLRDIKRIIEDIPQRLHSRLRLHGHFELTYEFNLGGIHLNRRCPEPPAHYSGAMSRSCHSIEELYRYPECDYLTLSPIFDSISKPGYRAAFTPEQLRSIPPGRVIALGGITPERVAALADYPFAGYAMLGHIFSK